MNSCWHASKIARKSTTISHQSPRKLRDPLKRSTRRFSALAVEPAKGTRNKRTGADMQQERTVEATRARWPENASAATECFDNEE
eukprot:s5958_g3.t1